MENKEARRPPEEVAYTEGVNTIWLEGEGERNQSIHKGPWTEKSNRSQGQLLGSEEKLKGAYLIMK